MPSPTPGPPRPRRIRALTRWLARGWLWLSRPFKRRRLERREILEIAGVRVAVLPGVHHPVVFRSGRLFADFLCDTDLLDTRRGRRALDLGTGTGVNALVAARRGFEVVGVDINPRAVRCARANAEINLLEDRIKVLRGDLFDPVAGQAFDLILFNPPFFLGQPQTPGDAAWYGDLVLDRFAQGLPVTLTPGGQAFVIMSTDGEEQMLLDALTAEPLDVEPAHRHDFGNEIMTIYRVTRTEPAIPRTPTAAPPP